MDFNAKCYPCYFDTSTLVSLNEKKTTNLKMETTILEMLSDIQSRQCYLHKYWYNLKYFVRALHGVYQLLYKILFVYGNSSMRTKLKCHNLINGPRTIQQNLHLFKELVSFTQIQMQIIGSLVCFHLKVNFQDKISKLFFWLTTFLHKVIWYDNSTDKEMHNGLPVKLNFL